MTTPAPFPLRSERSHNNTQANWISENTYTPTSVLYMITHNKVHMYKHVHYICDVQGTMTTPTPFPLRSQRSHNNTQANWISENTYTPTSVLYMITHNKVHMYKHVHYICDVQGTMTTLTLFPLRSQRSHNNIQANPISVNTYIPTSALYMALHITVYMYIALRTLQLTSAQKPHPLDSLRTLVEAIAIHTLIQLVQTHIHTHFRPVHGIISMYIVLGCYSVLWAQITTPSWLHPRIRRSHNITGDN